MTNGRVTENAYLQQLCRRVDRDRVSAKVKVINGDPLTVVKELSGPRSDLSEYEEVWVVVDHDGRDRHDFLAKCRRLSSKRTVVHGVVSVPCFEVWLNAHYAPVKNYQNQADAQAHYRELTGLSSKDAKMLPDDFPWDRGSQAAARCHLPMDGLPEPDTQGPCPSTTMPHLLRSLGLL
ncbi:RloB family protein [Actinomyces oris]|uniref:RloB family protein n=1 Tax=Actinomyces oris TaxID=544580 RepID=UPI002852A80B|nr:RloB family protein [Actinomyces oris]